MSNNDLSVFSFRNNSGTAQYSMNNGSSWTNFKNPVGTRNIYSNGTYDVTNYASAYVSVSTSLSETTLWTNSSPTSSFAAQTITLSSSISNFEYIKLTYRHNTSDSQEYSLIIPKTEFTKTNFGCFFGLSTSSFGGLRKMTYTSDTQLKFTGSYTFVVGSSSNPPLSNTNNIPTTIKGLK